MLETELRAKVPIDSIAFLSFTRRARAEAIERATKTLALPLKDLKYFRTIHSMAFRALKLKEGDVLSRHLLDEFGIQMGLKFGQIALTEIASEGVQSKEEGDALIALDNLARSRCEDLAMTWRFAKTDLTWTRVDHFARSYVDFKKERGVLDFTDVLAEFIRSELILPVEVCIVDEAQDLSQLQWRCVLQAAANAKRQFVAADDDQAIYQWAGADANAVIELEGERVVLDQSYRLPKTIHALAMSITKRIKKRVDKEFKPRAETGLIQRHSTMSSLPLDKGTWLILVRNRYLMMEVQHFMHERCHVFNMHGYSSINANECAAIYDWERLRKGKAILGDAARNVYSFMQSKVQIKHGHKKLAQLPDQQAVTLDDLKKDHGLLVEGPWFDVLILIDVQRRIYYRNVLRSSGTLRIEPRITLDTIHGAKGAECENVALFLEQSRRTHLESMSDPDSEHRVWYVAVSRAKTALHLIQSGNAYGYPI